MILESFNIKDNKGFTLLEILIAMSIFGITMATLYSTYTGSIRNMEETRSITEIYQKARVALERIVEDLESAYISIENIDSTSGDSNDSTGFYGEDLEIDGKSSDRLRFNSAAHQDFSGDIEGFGRARIVYYVKENQEEGGLNLYRTDSLEFDDSIEEGEHGPILCDNILSIDFHYFDDNGDGYDNWDSTSELMKNKMPSMVSVTLEIRNGLDEDSVQKFTTAASIPLVNEKK